MLKLSQLLSLPLINLYDIKVEGYVENIFINPDKKRIEQLLIYNEQNDEYLVVKYDDIYKIGADCILITNSSKITLFENLEGPLNKGINPLNAICYDIDGNLIGKVKEVNICNGQIVSININNQDYPLSTICGINNALLLISQNKNISIKRFKQSPKRIATLSKQTQNDSEPVVTIFTQNKITPSREITNYNFLINRLVLKDIKNPTGEVIAQKNTLVTLNTLNKLKYYGKLKELMLNSKIY